MIDAPLHADVTGGGGQAPRLLHWIAIVARVDAGVICGRLRIPAFCHQEKVTEARSQFHKVDHRLGELVRATAQRIARHGGRACDVVPVVAPVGAGALACHEICIRHRAADRDVCGAEVVAVGGTTCVPERTGLRTVGRRAFRPGGHGMVQTTPERVAASGIHCARIPAQMLTGNHAVIHAVGFGIAILTVDARAVVGDGRTIRGTINVWVGRA